MKGLRQAAIVCLSPVLLIPAGFVGAVRRADADQLVYSHGDGEKRAPEPVGFSADRLKALAELVGGRGLFDALPLHLHALPEGDAPGDLLRRG